MADMSERDYKQAHVTIQWKYDSPLISCRFDPLGRYIFAGAEDNKVVRWNLQDEKDRVTLEAHDSWVPALAHSHDGQYTITAGCDGRLIWWETASANPEPIRSIDAHEGWIRSLSVSPDGTKLASGGNDHVIRIWNLADGALLKQLKSHERHVYCVYFHPNESQTLLSGDLMGLLKQWDGATGNVIREFDAKALHSFNSGQGVDFGGVRAIAISEDGKYLAAGGLHKASNPLGSVHDPINLIWGIATGKLVQTCVSENIRSVIWRQVYLDQKTTMACSGGTSGGHLHFWSHEAPKELFRFKLPNIARDMDLHPDGLQVATAHHDKQIRITRLAKKQG